MEETLYPIKDYEGLYSVTKNGEIYAHKRNHFLRQILINTGYKQLDLCKKNIRKKKKIHRLVAETLLPNPENKPFVNHINGIKTDNRLENLEWVTSKENNSHAETLGLLQERHKIVSIKRRKLNKEEVQYALSLKLFKHTYKEIAQILKVSREVARKVCINGGYKW